MKVGIPKELKNHEYRVAITPAGVHELVRSGHEVFVQKDAGAGSLLPDDDFAAAGATILPDADEVWRTGELILKVKEPIPEEYPRLRKGQVLFTYLHLAASRECTDALLDSGITAIAYETVQMTDGSLPLLAPMSEVAGRMAPQVGAHHLQRDGGGRGVLMGGVSGVYAAKQRAVTAALAHQVVRANLRGEAARDLRHRGQQRQRPVGELHGLVGDGGDLVVQQGLRAGLVGREVEVGEQHQAGAHPVVLLGDRLLNLQHHVGGAPDLVRVGDDGGARGDVGVVLQRRALARALLHEHLVPGARQLMDAGRRERDTVLVVLDLAGDADPHDWLPLTGNSAVLAETALRAHLRTIR